MMRSRACGRRETRRPCRPRFWECTRSSRLPRRALRLSKPRPHRHRSARAVEPQRGALKRPGRPILNRTLLCALSLAAAPAAAQAPTELVGVFEPVNYNQDIELTDVFFVTPEIGYVGGAAAPSLTTTDARAPWTA